MYEDAITVRTWTSAPDDGEPNTEEIAPDATGTHEFVGPGGTVWFYEHADGVTVTSQPYCYDYSEGVWVARPRLEMLSGEPAAGPHLGHHTVWWRTVLASGTVSAEKPLVLKAA